jgi:hypothetical protein
MTLAVALRVPVHTLLIMCAWSAVVIQRWRTYPWPSSLFATLRCNLAPPPAANITNPRSVRLLGVPLLYAHWSGKRCELIDCHEDTACSQLFQAPLVVLLNS